MDKPILRNMLKVPSGLIDPRTLKKFRYRVTTFEVVERLNEDGELEEQSVRRIEIHQTYRTKGAHHYFHRGDLDKLRQLVTSDWEDYRTEAPMGAKFRLHPKFKPRYNQQDCLEDFIASEAGGQIIAPTAWGKTVFTIMLAARTQQRILVLMNQTNWLESWMKDIRKFTNHKQLTKRLGREPSGIIGSNFKVEDLYPCINLATPNSFWTKRGKVARKRFRDQFGIIVMDEAVHLPAVQTSKVFTSFNAKKRLALSADTERKDGTDKMIPDFAGPIVAIGEITGKLGHTQEVICHDTGIELNGNWIRGPLWFGAMETQIGGRDLLIDRMLENIIKDIQEGFKVLVLSRRKANIMKLVNELKQEVVRLDGKKRQLVVEQLMGGDKRQKEKLIAAGKGEYDVFVAMEACVGKNTDMPALSSLHDPFPSNGIPAIKQRAGRIRRPLEGKNHIRINIYRIRVDQENHIATRMMDAGWEKRFDWYESEGFKIIDKDRTDQRAGKAKKRDEKGQARSFIARHKRD